MTHTTVLLHDEHGTSAFCHTCPQRLEDSVTEAEAVEAMRQHQTWWRQRGLRESWAA